MPQPRLQSRSPGAIQSEKPTAEVMAHQTNCFFVMFSGFMACGQFRLAIHAQRPPPPRTVGIEGRVRTAAPRRAERQSGTALEPSSGELSRARLEIR